MTQLTQQPDPLILSDTQMRSTGKALLADFVQLAKIRIATMVVITAWIGFSLGSSIVPAAAKPGWITLLGVLIGTALSCMGASALNQVYERDTDARMHRTKDRPVPAGRVSVIQGYLFGLFISAVGLAVLFALTNALTAGLSLFTILSYTLIYTPLKRVTSLSTIIGAVPGALPPVMGYTAATNMIGDGAIVMFGILFLWQLPHFLAIAWMYREDYARAGFPMLPVLEPDGTSTFRQMLIGTLALLPMSLMPTMMNISGVIYFVGALLLSLGFIASAVLVMFQPTTARARLAFFTSLVYLPGVLLLMVIDRV